MAYQGISPYLYRNNLTNVQLLDDISGSFNGTTTQFNLTTNGSPFHAVSARSLLIILGGIVQEPDADYTVNAGVITFTTAPLSGLTFAARNIYGLNRLTGINDGLVTPASLSLGGPEWDTSGNLTVDGNITQTGETNNVYINTDTPTVRPTLDLNFERDQRLDSRITYSRNSTATYLGSDGLIKTALVNEPRFEFDTDGNCLGFLIEESRTNVGIYSDQFNQWTNDGVSVTANATTAPDGTTTADLVTGVSGNRRIYLINVISNGPVYTYSIFVKKNVGSTIRFDNINVGSTATEFNFDTGVLTLSGNFTSGTVTSYLNGWYRISLTYTSNGASASLGPYFVNTNDSCYMWGYQFELGSFATSYIPTTTTSVTRSADNANITNPGITFPCTIFGEYDTFGTQYARRLYGLTPTGNSSTTVRPFVNNNGTLDFFTSYVNNHPTTATVSANTFFKFSHFIGLSGSTNRVSLNGTSVVNSTTSSLNTSTTSNLLLGNSSVGDSPRQWCGHIKRFIAYNSSFSNSQLQNLTS
jgi:hypothetical protein